MTSLFIAVKDIDFDGPEVKLGGRLKRCEEPVALGGNIIELAVSTPVQQPESMRPDLHLTHWTRTRRRTTHAFVEGAASVSFP